MSIQKLSLRAVCCDFCGVIGPTSTRVSHAIHEAIACGWEVVHGTAACPRCQERGLETSGMAWDILPPADMSIGPDQIRIAT